MTRWNSSLAPYLENLSGSLLALTEQQQQQQYTLYLPSALSVIAQVLVGLIKQLKQMIQIEHNIVKNPNWPEANQLAIYKRGRQPG